MLTWLMLFGGGWLLYFGAQWFVAGASGLALALRVPQLIVGLTVVAYGTSAPEIVVGIQAALDGHPDVALGNVVGSNIANVGLILGIATLIRPARVDGSLRGRELPVMLAATALVPLVLWDAVVTRWEGVALIGCGVAYTMWMVGAARSSREVVTALVEVGEEQEVAAAAGAPSPIGTWRAVAVAAGGLLVLLLGGQLFVRGAVQAATILGMSERLVGLTIVAVGTSLPELLTSVIAARRGYSDLAIGNVVGSNIFNIVICLGSASAVTPLQSAVAPLMLDLVALGIVTLIAGYFLRSERTMARWEGGVLLSIYLLLNVGAVLRG